MYGRVVLACGVEYWPAKGRCGVERGVLLQSSIETLLDVSRRLERIHGVTAGECDAAPTEHTVRCRLRVYMWTMAVDAPSTAPYAGSLSAATGGLWLWWPYTWCTR